MSVPFPDDLLCDEESGILFGDQPECSSDIESPERTEESIAGFIEDERNYVPGIDYVERFQSRTLDASAREEAVAWILKVQSYYGFQPLTAYLSVNYYDRFMCSRRLPANGWPMHLLAVACLSLAAKMEEPLVPSLVDLQIEGGSKYIFEPGTICRMELLVLGALDWRLRSVTPFCFLSFFAHKLDSTGTCTGFLISRATQIILANIREASLLEYWPSCIAAATMLCAANDLPNFALIKPGNAESWCDGLSKEKIVSCYQLLMQEITVDDDMGKKPLKVLPQLQIMSSDSSSSSSPSSPSSSPYKRRKLNNSLWVDDDKGSSE